MTIIDTHVHFNDPADVHKPPVKDAVPMPHYTIDELMVEARKAGVDKIVQVTPSTMGYDNSYSYQIAESHPDVVGVVARFDPLDAGAEKNLREIAAHPQTTGVRSTMTTPALVAGFLDGSFDPLFKVCEELDLWFELFVPFRVEEMQAAVKRFPRLRFLIDHIGLQVKKDGSPPELDPWRKWPQLLALAKEPNTWIKVSYFPEAAKDIDSYPYPVAQQRFRELYEAVGPSKLVWGSNFPPVLRTCTYKQAVDFMRVDCTFLSDADRAAIMGENYLTYLQRHTKGGR